MINEGGKFLAVPLCICSMKRCYLIWIMGDL